MPQRDQIDRPEDAVRELRAQGDEAIQLGREFGRATKDTARDLSLASRLQLERSPYLTLAATFGVGYVLGGGIPLRLLTFAAAFGGRVAASMALRELATTAVRATTGGSAGVPEGDDGSAEASSHQVDE